MQTLTRKCTFDSGHRVMNEKMKCFNMHGHTYLCNLTFSFTNMESIGYAIDFKEVKRVGCQWIDDMLDHGQIVNPEDEFVIEAAKKTESKIWYMSLNGEGNYCNPTAENISKEVFLAMEVLFEDYPSLKVTEIELYETPNCSVKCFEGSITESERTLWRAQNYMSVAKYREDKGMLNYDDRN